MKSIYQITYVIIFSALLGSCNNDIDIPEAINDDTVIEQFIADNNLNATKSDEWEVYYVELEAGTGEQVTRTSIVDVEYENALLDGSVISRDSSYVFVPEEYSFIQGVARGALTMSEGGKSLILIPSRFAYGAGSGELNGVFVPANSVLQSTITVKEIRTREEQLIVEELAIENYLVDQQLDSNAFFLSDGLFKSIVEEGDVQSSNPSQGSTVTIAYEGSFLDGTTFDNSESAQFSLSPGSLIDGFYNAVLSMKINEEAIFAMTSDQAYGDTGTNGIDPFTPLIFKIKLINHN